jgi:hypothetical protein
MPVARFLRLVLDMLLKFDGKEAKELSSKLMLHLRLLQYAMFLAQVYSSFLM